MSKQSLIYLATLTLTGGAAVNVQASHYDGRTPLLCSIYQLFECDHPNQCVSVTPDEVRGMSHFELDFRNKVMTRAGIEGGRQSAIDTVETRVDGKLVVQGIEDGDPEARDGAGWSVSIMDPEGTMVLAAAADGFGIMALGACVPQP